MSDVLSIPNKSHFNFDEVATITGVKKYVLRFWETEFDEISPIVSSSGQKLYQHSDIEAIAQIKILLFQKKYPIEKAKAILQTGELDESFDEKEEVAPKKEEVKAKEISKNTETINFDSSKLSLAKEKLSEIQELAKSLQETHNWK